MIAPSRLLVASPCVGNTTYDSCNRPQGKSPRLKRVSRGYERAVQLRVMSVIIQHLRGAAHG